MAQFLEKFVGELPDFIIASMPLFGRFIDRGIEKYLIEGLRFESPGAENRFRSNFSFASTISNCAVATIALCFKVALSLNLSLLNRLVGLAVMCLGFGSVAVLWSKGAREYQSLSAFSQIIFMSIPLLAQTAKFMLTGLAP